MMHFIHNIIENTVCTILYLSAVIIKFQSTTEYK